MLVSRTGKLYGLNIKATLASKVQDNSTLIRIVEFRAEEMVIQKSRWRRAIIYFAGKAGTGGVKPQAWVHLPPRHCS